MDEKNFHPLNSLVSGLKTKAHRSSAYLKFLRKLKCWSCPSKVDITASHIFRGYHGLKNHDWGSIPQCSYCHWQMEYYKVEFQKRHRLPEAADAERYYQAFLREEGRQDDRTEEQKVPV